MICNFLASNLCGTYENKNAKCLIAIDANHNIPAEVDTSGKFNFTDVPIDILKQKGLICIVMSFPEELMSQAVTLIKLFADYSDRTNHLSREIEVIIKEKMGLDFIIGTLYQWFIIPDNSNGHTLMLVFDKDTFFPFFKEVAMDKQNQTIKIYLSESQKNKITNQASEQQLSVSEYAKEILIKGPVILYITVNDLLDYTCQIYETNNKIQELLSLLNQTDTIEALYAARIIKTLLTEINNLCKEALETNYNERKKIYNELESQIKNSLS